MAVTLLRHTTPDVIPGTCYGRTDLALATTFEDEAAHVLSGLPAVNCVISSPLQRCRHLSGRVTRDAKHEVQISNLWIEMDFGIWEGVLWSDIPRADLDAWAEDFLHYDGHGGESVKALETRVRAALEATPDGALVVTHSGCIRAACAIWGIKEGWDTDTPFGGLVAGP